MGDVVDFTGALSVHGETFANDALSNGYAEAASREFSRQAIDASMSADSRLTTYFLCLLGSADAHEQRQGAYGLARLLGRSED